MPMESPQTELAISSRRGLRVRQRVIRIGYRHLEVRIADVQCRKVHVVETIDKAEARALINNRSDEALTLSIGLILSFASSAPAFDSFAYCSLCTFGSPEPNDRDARS